MELTVKEEQGSSDTGNSTSSVYSRPLTSSLATCAPHVICFEASITGLITSKPHAGTLPIENVVVVYRLLDENENVIGCDDCSGSLQSDNGGSFKIDIKVDHPSFKGKNDKSFPLKLFFSKTTKGPSGGESIVHKFLCNEGEDSCNVNDGGHIIYLRHLEFNKEVNVYDDTSVPFSGKVTVKDTDNLCGVSGVGVELVQNAGEEDENEVGFAETDQNGEFTAVVPIGSRIDRIELNMDEHTFVPSPHSRFQTGIEIEGNGYYGDMDFVDITTTTLEVEVAGGFCNKTLGESHLQIKIVGCEWKGIKGTQDKFAEIHKNVPAQPVEVEVIDIKDQNGDRIQPIFVFFQGTQPVKRVVDLTEISATDVKLDLVRFQYDGTVGMTVDIEDENECLPDPADYSADSVHVLPGNSFFDVTIKVYYNITATETCDIVSDDVKLMLINYVGVSNDPDADQTYCNGGCLLSFDHDEDDNGGKINAHKAVELRTGEPNILSPYARNIIFQVGNLQHKAAVVITGMYKKEKGQSFAFPSEDPIMVLRDPPGGLSTATYQNIKSTLKMRHRLEMNRVTNKSGGKVTETNEKQVSEKVIICLSFTKLSPCFYLINILCIFCEESQKNLVSFTIIS